MFISIGFSIFALKIISDMDIGIITDTDFLPSLYQRKESKDLYQLVYGILIYHDCDRIYELIAHLVLEQKSDVLMKAKITRWKIELQRIIQKLKTFGSNKNGIKFQVFVFPYHYSGNIAFTINLFDFAIIVLEEMTQCRRSEIKLIKPEHFHYPIRSMKEQFEKMAERNKELYESCLKDEMVRRSLLPNSEKTEKYELDLYNKELIHKKRNTEESDYTIEEIQDIVENIKRNNVVNEVTHTLDILNRGENLSQIAFFGVIFYALKEHIKERKIIQGIATYAMRHCYTQKAVKQDTIRKYYDVYNNVQYKKKAAEQIKVDSFKYIQDELMRLKLDVPEEVINELTPIHKTDAL